MGLYYTISVCGGTIQWSCSHYVDSIQYPVFTVTLYPLSTITVTVSLLMYPLIPVSILVYPHSVTVSLPLYPHIGCIPVPTVSLTGMMPPAKLLYQVLAPPAKVPGILPPVLPASPVAGGEVELPVEVATAKQ